jgi:homoserine kinase
VKGVFVRVPATTANLGSGFDVLGLALALYNDVYVTVRPSGLPLRIVNEGEGADSLPTNKQHLVYQAMSQLFQKARKPLPRFLDLRLVNRIPLARGLGSSSAAIVGGLLAANTLLGNFFSLGELVILATKIEGHPDNVTPALVGGLCVCVQDNGRVHYGAWKERSLFAGLKAVVCVPSFKLSTQKARSVLPGRVPFGDAVFNISRVALFLTALKSRRFDLLGPAMEDRLHQPYRASLVPGLSAALLAARKAGAHGAALSGAGPSVLALAPTGKASWVAQAMEKGFSRCKVSSHSLILDVDFRGVKVKT